MSDPDAPSTVTIAVRDDGNLRVVGPITLLDGAGHAFEVEAGKAVFLCRCGGSATKPFCDASHRAISFRSAVRVAPGAGDPATG